MCLKPYGTRVCDILQRECAAPPTSLDGFVKEVPATLVHHVHVCFVVDQRGGDTLQFTRQSQVQGQVSIVVQFIQLPRQLQMWRIQDVYKEGRKKGIVGFSTLVCKLILYQHSNRLLIYPIHLLAPCSKLLYRKNQGFYIFSFLSLLRSFPLADTKLLPLPLDNDKI